MSSLRLAFFLTAAGVCLVSLAARAPLIDPDEGLHAAIAQEMLLRHDYVTPTFLGEPFLDKPILFFWTEAASLAAFGMDETAVRLPPLLFGLFGACTVALLGAALFEPRAGYAAGIAYATMLLPVGVSEVAVHDVALVPFLVLSCLGIWRIAHGGRLMPWTIVVGACLGLSILTKGLVGVAFAGLFGLAVVAFDRRALPRLIVAGIASAAIAVLVAAPWYVAMERAHPGYLHYYFVERHVQGYFTATQRHAGRGWWYYVPIVLGGALPWLPFAIAGSSDAAAARSRRVVWTWFFAGLTFLSAGESKLATYVLPVFPAIAMEIGRSLAASSARSGWSKARYSLFVLTCALLPVVAAAAFIWRFPASTSGHAGAMAAVTTVIVVAGYAGSRQRGDRRVPWMSGIAFVSFAAIILLVLPRAARWMTARDLATILNGRTSLPPRVLVFDERIGSVIFYLSPDLRREAAPDRFADATLADVFQRLNTLPPTALLAVRADQLPRVQRLFTAPLTPDAQSGVYSVFSVATLRHAADQ
ncbi:MAG TPA: glycosyltransferase family 39 protein [Vicinamibacterales bacterium]|jgi:4-amino-4-deoxy-L-arabinose transferase-like glycosyltransferase|nr:glycosyltransferase family 39 protein [Vicinamibacterales bacterium]